MDCDNNINDEPSNDSIEFTVENIEELTSNKIHKSKAIQPILKPYYNEDADIFEIGVDEVGRGPLFGRV